MQNRNTSPRAIRTLRTINDWFRATFPALIVIGAGATVFRSAVVDSITSTPHPELVYLILAGFFVALFFTWYVLYTYTREERTLHRWQSLEHTDRVDFIGTLRRPPALRPIYDLLVGKSVLPLRMRQSAVDSEFQEFEKNLSARLALPSYIGGALIGLGLVGTFIGLLETLRELGSLFTALIAEESGTGKTQADMFRDMITRLQAPMRGMGTAFVASLYGLSGSLIVGLIIMTVRKVGSRLTHTVRNSIREYDYGAGSNLALAIQADGELAWAESARWQALFNEMKKNNQNTVALMVRLQDEVIDVLRSANEFKDILCERNDQDRTISRTLTETINTLGRATEQYRFILRSFEETRQDMQGMVQATHCINDALKERNRIEAMVQNVLNQGPHWMNAWDDISTEIRRVRYLLEGSAQQSHTEQTELVNALLLCRQSFEDMSARLKLSMKPNDSRD